MGTIPVSRSFNPTTQGKVHPLQGDHEVFLGYFNERFFETHLTYTTKRIVRDDPDNPYRNLHAGVRCYPVFAERNEALERHYALRAGTLDAEAVRRAREKVADDRREELALERSRVRCSFNVNAAIGLFVVLLVVLYFRPEDAGIPFLFSISALTAGIAAFALCAVRGMKTAKRRFAGTFEEK